MTEVFADLPHFQVSAQCVQSDLVKPVESSAFLPITRGSQPGRIITLAGLNKPPLSQNQLLKSFQPIKPASSRQGLANRKSNKRRQCRTSKHDDSSSCTDMDASDSELMISDSDEDAPPNGKSSATSPSVSTQPLVSSVKSPASHHSDDPDSISDNQRPGSSRRRPTQRTSSVARSSSGDGESERLQTLEREHEVLNQSLAILSTHFAQVQFRLKQVVNIANTTEKERLLKELEEFAFRGNPDVRDLKSESIQPEPNQEEGAPSSEQLERQRRQQVELIAKLKAQLTDLESFAYQSGSVSELPTADLMERQRLVLSELRSRLDLTDLDRLEQLPPDQLRHAVDKAVGQIVNPVKVKENVVRQLKTQIEDLERFVHFLQISGSAAGNASSTEGGAAGQNSAALNGAGVSPSRSPGRSGARRKPRLSQPTSAGSRSSRVRYPGAVVEAESGESISRERTRRSHGRSPKTSESDAALGCGCLGAPTADEATRAGRHRHGSQSQEREPATTNADPKQAEAMMFTAVKRMHTLLQIFMFANLSSCMPCARMKHAFTSDTVLVKEHHYGETLARLEILVDRVYQLGLSAGMQCRRSLTGGALRVAEFHYPQGCANPAVPLDSPSPATPTHAHFVQSSFDLETIGVKQKLRDSVDPESGQCSSSGATEEPSPSRERAPDARPAGAGGGGGDDGETVTVQYTSDTEECYIAEAERELTQLVRKRLLPCLRDLIAHGMLLETSSRSLLPFGCIPAGRGSSRARRVTHPWHLFLKFYELKNGKRFSDAPTRKLCEAFDIDFIAGKPITAKQTLLMAIERVLSLHSKFKRSDDSQLKALFCIALNEGRLVPWLKLVLHNATILDQYYEPWSYAVSTGFEDALRSLMRLADIRFSLPFDLAVRQLQNIQDAF